MGSFAAGVATGRVAGRRACRDLPSATIRHPSTQIHRAPTHLLLPLIPAPPPHPNPHPAPRRLQPCPGPGLPHQDPHLHLLSPQVHHLRNLHIREDWLLALHLHLQVRQASAGRGTARLGGVVCTRGGFAAGVEFSACCPITLAPPTAGPAQSQFVFIPVCPCPPVLALSLLLLCRHLQRNPDNQVYPMFEFFENWCQDENRHGDFLTAVLKSRPELLSGWEARCVGRGACCAALCCRGLPACMQCSSASTAAARHSFLREEARDLASLRG